MWPSLRAGSSSRWHLQSLSLLVGSLPLQAGPFEANDPTILDLISVSQGCQLQKCGLPEVTFTATRHDAVAPQARSPHRPGPMDIPSSQTGRVTFATVRASRGRRNRTPPSPQFPPLSL